MGQKSSKQPQVDPRYLAPQKLYCYNEVDLRKLRRLIKDRKLAPCFPGVDSESQEVILEPLCPKATCGISSVHLTSWVSSAVGGLPNLLPQVSKPQSSSMLP